MKKKSLIRQLLLDSPCSLESLGLNEEQSRLMDALSDLDTEIRKKLKGDKKALDLFEKYDEALNGLCYEELCRTFEKGVKFGVLFGMELVQE